VTDDARVARRALVQRYLLGTLDEAAAVELRARIVTDESVFDEVREVEIDLLDDLARGTLDAETRALVESRLLPIDSNQDAWTVARALADVRATRPARRNEPPAIVTGWWRRNGWLAAAATVIAAAGLVFMLSRGSSPGDGRDPADPGPAGPEATTATARPSPSPSTPSSTPSPPSSAPAPPATAPSVPQSPPSPSPSNAAPAVDGSVVALYLPAGVLRGARPSVRIAPATRTVRIELEVAPPLAMSPSSHRSPLKVAIALVDASGREVWSSSDVLVAIEDGQAVAAIDVPAASLPAGALEAVISDATPATPARLPFLVLRD
jgi:hypothetical protein